MVSFKTHDKIQRSKMTYKEALEIVGPNRARWELLKMKKALSDMPLLNSVEDEYRLKAVKTLLKSRRAK